MPTFVLFKRFNFLKEFIVLLVYELLNYIRLVWKRKYIKEEKTNIVQLICNRIKDASWIKYFKNVSSQILVIDPASIPEPSLKPNRI